MGNFCPPGSGSGSGFRIRIRIHWPDWIRTRNTGLKGIFSHGELLVCQVEHLNVIRYKLKASCFSILPTYRTELLNNKLITLLSWAFCVFILWSQYRKTGRVPPEGSEYSRTVVTYKTEPSFPAPLYTKAIYSLLASVCPNLPILISDIPATPMQQSRIRILPNHLDSIRSWPQPYYYDRPKVRKAPVHIVVRGMKPFWEHRLVNVSDAICLD